MDASYARARARGTGLRGGPSQSSTIEAPQSEPMMRRGRGIGFEKGVIGSCGHYRPIATPRLTNSQIEFFAAGVRFFLAFQSSVRPMNSLDPRVEKSLRDAHDALALRGELLSEDRMQASYAAFRSRFGPDALKSLDGPALLNAMHFTAM